MVGEKEKSNNAVNVRTRDNRIHGEISVTSAIDKLKNLKLSRTLNAEEEFWHPSLWSRLRNLVLTLENVFFLINVSSSSENFGPTDRAPDGHSEKRQWMSSWHMQCYFTYVPGDKNRAAWEILHFKFPKCLERLKWENVIHWKKY